MAATGVAGVAWTAGFPGSGGVTSIRRAWGGLYNAASGGIYLPAQVKLDGEDISAGALLDDGAPVLIVDVDDLLRSIARLASDGRLAAPEPAAAEPPSARKRVLVVEDSLTVRELERKVLLQHGYEVEVAVDGMDGWNAVRDGRFDLVVTDVDMPRMDGIELVSRITRDPQLRSTPVMIVSYKDREDDRRRGLEAGAAYYLTKGSFQNDTLAHAVVDLIGEPRS